MTRYFFICPGFSKLSTMVRNGGWGIPGTSNLSLSVTLASILFGGYPAISIEPVFPGIKQQFCTTGSSGGSFLFSMGVLNKEQYERFDLLMGEARALVAAGDTANLQQAIAKFDTAIRIVQTAGDHILLLNALDQRGDAAFALGNFQLALTSYTQALTLSEKVSPLTDERRRVAHIRQQIGKTYRAIGNLQQALATYNSALHHDSWDCRTRAITLISIGEIYADLGDPAKALAYYNYVLQEMGSYTDSSMLRNISKAYFDLGQPQKSLDFLDRSMELDYRFGHNAGLELLQRDQPSEQQQKQLQKNRLAAIASLEDAIAITRQLQSRLTDPSLKMLYAKTIQTYEKLKTKLEANLHPQ